MNNELNNLLKDAQDLKEMGFEEEALLILEEISQEFPNCLESYLEQIDIILNRKDNYEEGLEIVIEKALRALQIAPDNIDANYYLGYAYSLKRKWAKALVYLKKAQDMDDKDVDIMRALGVTLFHTGKQTEGIALLKRSIHNDPYYVEAMEDLAECYLFREKFAEAYVVIEKALEIAPHSETLLRLKLVADSFEIYKKISK